MRVPSRMRLPSKDINEATCMTLTVKLQQHAEGQPNITFTERESGEMAHFLCKWARSLGTTPTVSSRWKVHPENIMTNYSR